MLQCNVAQLKFYSQYNQEWVRGSQKSDIPFKASGLRCRFLLRVTDPCNETFTSITTKPPHLLSTLQKPDNILPASQSNQVNSITKFKSRPTDMGTKGKIHLCYCKLTPSLWLSKFNDKIRKIISKHLYLYWVQSFTMWRRVASWNFLWNTSRLQPDYYVWLHIPDSSQ
jgi:hypothetical protein